MLPSLTEHDVHFHGCSRTSGCSLRPAAAHAWAIYHDRGHATAATRIFQRFLGRAGNASLRGDADTAHSTGHAHAQEVRVHAAVEGTLREIC